MKLVIGRFYRSRLTGLVYVYAGLSDGNLRLFKGTGDIHICSSHLYRMFGITDIGHTNSNSHMPKWF